MQQLVRELIKMQLKLRINCYTNLFNYVIYHLGMFFMKFHRGVYWDFRNNYHYFSDNIHNWNSVSYSAVKEII